MFLSAGGNTNGPVEAAVKLARDRGRIIDIGKMKLDLPWNAYYEKELDVRFSRSYGPGRYDTRYELDGIDYPAGYVRWTEKRNLESFLDLLARNQLEVATLIDGVFPMEDAAKVYEDLKTGALKAVGVLLEYPVPAADAPAPGDEAACSRARSPRRVRAASAGRKDQIEIGFVGAGNYAQLYAAAAPGQAAGGQPRARRHHEVAVGGQRAAEVRLHHRVDRLGLRLRAMSRSTPSSS